MQHTLFHRTAMLALTAALLALVAGCPQADPRTTNQGGGNIITAGGKLATGNVGDLNPDEWQVVIDNVEAFTELAEADIGDVEITELSDDEAQAIVDFLDTNGIQTLEDLENLDVSELDVPDILADLFGAQTA